MGKFQDAKVIVTGGTRGIGAAISKSFVKEGADVTAIYAYNEEGAAKLKEELSSYGNISVCKLDVSSYSDCEKVFKEYSEKNGHLDILVNNAGIRGDAVVAMMQKEIWDKVIDTNLTGTFNCSKLAIPMMLVKRYGRIINITSPIGRFGFAGQSNYAASKAGQVAFTKSLSKEVAKRGITVNLVSPGFIETDFISDIDESMIKKYKEMVPLRRFGTVDDVARAVLFLAEVESSYITGTVLYVTGGL